MLKFLIFYFVLISCISCNPKDIRNQHPDYVLDIVKSLYKSHKSISFDLILKKKTLFSNDTNTSKIKCYIMRVPNQQFINGYIWYCKDGEKEVLFDLNEITEISHYYNKCLVNRSYKERIKANTDLFWYYYDYYFIDIPKLFIWPSIITNYSKDTNLKVRIKENIHDGKHTWKFQVFYPDENDITNNIVTYYINRDYIIDKITNQAKFKGFFQYMEWKYKNIIFDNVDTAKISKVFKKDIKQYNIVDVDPFLQDVEMDNINFKGTSAPDFEANFFQEQKVVHLKDISGKLILLDFWYMSCFACNMAIPMLNELHEKYSKQGLSVIGVNCFDKLEEKKELLKKFIHNQKINYPVLLANKEVVEKYKVKAYPTIFLIDRNGKIIYTEVGYQESNKDTIEKIIKANL